MERVRNEEECMKKSTEELVGDRNLLIFGSNWFLVLNRKILIGNLKKQ